MAWISTGPEFYGPNPESSPTQSAIFLDPGRNPFGLSPESFEAQPGICWDSVRNVVGDIADWSEEVSDSVRIGPERIRTESEDISN